MQTCRFQVRIAMRPVAGDGEGIGEEDEEDEEETECVDESHAEAVEGKEEDNHAADEEFIDKKHESQFCLETNFMDKGEQETSESNTDSQGKTYSMIKTLFKITDLSD